MFEWNMLSIQQKIYIVIHYPHVNTEPWTMNIYKENFIWKIETINLKIFMSIILCDNFALIIFSNCKIVYKIQWS